MTLDLSRNQLKTTCCLHSKGMSHWRFSFYSCGYWAPFPCACHQAMRPAASPWRCSPGSFTGTPMTALSRLECKDLLATHMFSQWQALALRSLMLLLSRGSKVRIGFGKNSKPPSNQTRNGIQRTTVTGQLSLREGIRKYPGMLGNTCQATQHPSSSTVIKGKKQGQQQPRLSV